MSTTARNDGGSVTYVYLLTLVAALGGLLFGYDTAVIAGATGSLRVHFELTPFWEGFAAASALAGWRLGAGSAGFLSDRFGRKKVLILAALAFFVSALGTALPRTLVEFIVFRFIGGIGIGAASITSPMYIAEIAPFRIRGRLVSLNQLAIVSGMLIVYFVNYFIADYGLSQDKRRVDSHVAQYGAALDVATVRTRLEKETPNLVNQQIEKFLIEPRRVLDRQAVVEFLAKQGLQVDAAQVAPGDGRSRRRRSATSFASGCRRRTAAASKSSFARRERRSTARPWPTFSKRPASRPRPSTSTWPRKACKAGTASTAGGGCSARESLRPWSSCCCCSWCPKAPAGSPRQQRRDEALAILTRVDGVQYARDELRSIEEALAQESGRLTELWEPWMRRLLVLGVALAVLQQVTGVNVFLYFAPKIFESLGAGAGTAMMQTVIVGAVNMLFTVLAISVVNRLGRKPLMLIGSAGMGLALTALGLAAYYQLFQWWALVFVLGYIACFAMSVGPVVWVILTEIFPTQIRGRAMGMATICLWVANYVVSLTFPMMNDDPWLLVRFHHGFPFWVYAAFCVVLLAVVWFWVPETKGRSLEEIERSLRK